MPSRRAMAAPDMPASRSSATRRRVTISRVVDILDLRVGGSSNGKTPASGAGYRGSSPCPPVDSGADRSRTHVRTSAGRPALVTSVASSATEGRSVMSFVAVFFIGFFFIALVLGPLFGAEDRPDFLRPDSKFRKMVTPLRRP